MLEKLFLPFTKSYTTYNVVLFGLYHTIVTPNEHQGTPECLGDSDSLKLRFN